MKRSLPAVSILFGGLLPVLIYWLWHGSSGIPGSAELQSVNSSAQFALMTSLFNIKPIYMFLCVLLLLTLWGRTSLPARSLFYGFSALLAGELICGATYATLGRELVISEHIHSYGMVLEFAFTIFALIELIDRCALEKRIVVRPIFAVIAIMGGIASFVPLSVSTAQSGYHADLFGFPYTYIRFAFNQWVESRAIPVASLCFFLLALFTSNGPKRMRRPLLAKIGLSAGMGLLAFSMLRLTLGAFFAERLVWFEFWEEVTQLVLVSTIVFMMWQFKREWIMERIALFR